MSNVRRLRTDADWALLHQQDLLDTPKRQQLIALALRYRHLNCRWSVWTPEKQELEFRLEYLRYLREWPDA
jgi:hypothetical protein